MFGSIKKKTNIEDKLASKKQILALNKRKTKLASLLKVISHFEKKKETA